MEARKRPFVQLCRDSTCRKPATYEVIDDRDTIVGRYCEDHAEEHVRHLNNYAAAIRAALR
jgi:hypothetical protein